MSSAATGQKPARKFPPPCWTRDEALVLIEAYRDRWYALHRAFLRTPDWDAVAEKVTNTCPGVLPPKTSAQCRHKMEKLRQRHRAEKQRASAFSGDRFFSTWFYFEAMEAMENGSNTETEHSTINSPQILIPQPHALNPGPGRGIRFKPSAVQNLVTLATSSTKHTPKPSPNLNSRVSSRYSFYPNQNDEHGCLVETPIRESKIHKISSIGSGTRIKSSISPEESGRSSLRPRKISKVVKDDEVEDDNGEMWIKVPRKNNLFRGMHQNEKHYNEGKKVNGGLSEVVSSIKLLGDGFMKMEKMKMDVAREIEKMRIDAEMKRNELILESQRQIVDAFVKGVIEARKQSTTMAHL